MKPWRNGLVEILDILSLIPQFGGLLYTVAAFIVALSIIVFVHEFGHYIVGRWSGIHAEVFSIGFGPVLISRRDRRGTRWQVAALPFGGYVKFLGDADAASGRDAEAMAAAAQDPARLRRTMHGAPLWARAATVAAGPMFNFAMSIVVFAAIFMLRGVVAEPLTVGAINPLPEAGAYELRAGDEILAIAGERVPDAEDPAGWSDFLPAIPINDVLDYDVRRDGSRITVSGPYPMPPLIAQVAPRSAAMDSGLRPGDVIVAADGEPITAFEQLRDMVEASDGAPLLIEVWRRGEVQDFTLTPRRTDEPAAGGGFSNQWRIGIAGEMAFTPATRTAGPVEALGSAFAQTGAVITGSLSGLWHMLTGAISSCNMSGPIGIAEASGAMASQGTQSFIWFIAVLSTAIGLLNLFPIPALDGGHLLFYAYEAVAGRPLSDRVLRLFMAFGISLILGLMIFALSNDLFC